MKIQAEENGIIKLTEVFNPIVLETAEGERLAVQMRDGAFELSVGNIKDPNPKSIVFVGRDDSFWALGSPKITATDALFGFAGWLTSRDEAVTFSARHDAAIAAELVAEWIAENELGGTSPLYPSNISHASAR